MALFLHSVFTVLHETLHIKYNIVIIFRSIYTAQLAIATVQNGLYLAQLVLQLASQLTVFLCLQIIREHCFAHVIFKLAMYSQLPILGAIMLGLYINILQGNNISQLYTKLIDNAHFLIQDLVMTHSYKQFLCNFLT